MRIKLLLVLLLCSCSKGESTGPTKCERRLAICKVDNSNLAAALTACEQTRK